MKKKGKRCVSKRRPWRFILMLTFMTLGLAGLFTTSYAALSVKYVGPLYTSTPQEELRVGEFLVNGKAAFCIEHMVETPPTGTAVTSKVYRNQTIRKILYYGWNGPAQWSGFKDKKQGITLTSLLLSENYSERNKIGKYNYVGGMPEFRSFVNSQKSPALELSLNKSSVKAFYSAELDAERTENLTVVGDGAGKLTIKLPEGYQLYDNASETIKEGDVELSVGDSFYIRTKAEYSEKKQITLTGRRRCLQPMIFVTASSNLQDLARLEAVTDDSDVNVLNITWPGKRTLRIVKKDVETGVRLNGASFKLIELGKETVAPSGTSLDNADSLRKLEEGVSVHTIKSGGAINVESILQCGRKYAVVEMEAPYGYTRSDEVCLLDITGEKDVEEVVFENLKQKVYLIINKTGDKYEIENGRLENKKTPLAGAKFNITAEEDILDWGGESYLYNRGEVVEEIETDENGFAMTKAIPSGRYSLEEIETAKGYLLDRQIRFYNLKIRDGKKELKYTVPWHNKIKETKLLVTKYDADTKEKLEGASFEIENQSGKKLEVRTNKKGTATINNLPEGEYSMKEIDAPEGYDVDGKLQMFTIETEGEQSSVALESHDKKSNLPITGDDSDMKMQLVLLGSSLVCLLAMLCRKKIKG